jgi:hypothetical protein
MKNKTTLRNNTTLAALALLATAAGIAPKAHASDVFSVTATGAGVTSQTKANSDLEALIRDVIESREQFINFRSTNFNSILNWGGVPGALNFQQTHSGAVFTGVLTSHVLPGLRVTKSATSQDELGDQFVEFFKKDGSGVYSELLKAISAQSKVSPTDGNPNADTARNATVDFQNGAQTSGETKAEKKAGAAANVPNAFQFDMELGTFKANGIEGRTYSLPLAKRFTLSERVGLNLGIPLSLSEIGGATVYSGGLNVGLPISLQKKSMGQPITWRVTPFGGASVTASKDMLVGGTILRAGLSNLMAYDFGKFEVAIGNQFSQHSSVEMEIAGTKIDPRVDQQILKNGIQVCVPIAENWIVEAYAIQTNFLAEAGVKHYATFGGDIGYRVHDTKDAIKRVVGTLRVGAYIDEGSGFSGAHFRIGSSWKF